MSAKGTLSLPPLIFRNTDFSSSVETSVKREIKPKECDEVFFKTSGGNCKFADETTCD